MSSVPPKNYTHATKTWLENFTQNAGKSSAIPDDNTILRGGSFANLCLAGVDIVSVEHGHVFCSFSVPSHLTDEEGNWQVGAIATLIDVVGSAAITTTNGIVMTSVDIDITYFHLPKLNEEVEIEARILEHKGKLTAMVLEIRKKRTRELVAVGRQWMTARRSLL